MKSGDGRIAFQVFGEGPDIVLIPGGPSHLELRWHLRGSAAYYRQLATFCRVITFDRRGIGMSDRMSASASLEDEVGDVAAVMQAAGSDRAFIHGHMDGGAVAVLFAAARSACSLGLIVESCPPRILAASDYPFGFAPADWERLAAQVEEWSLDEMIRWAAPGADAEGRDIFRRYAAAGAGPARLAASMRLAAQIDLREVLPTIDVPSLVLARPGDVFAPVEAVRCLAEEIPGSRFELVLGSDHSVDERFEAVVDEVHRFVTGLPRAPRSDRVLTTLLFVDVVGSTGHVRELGDSRWRKLLDRHDDAIRRVIGEVDGRLVKSTGDGALATFDGTAKAIHAACAIQSALSDIGIGIRAGVHTGEVERRGEDIAGLAVHVAARVQAVAAPGEILVTRTVADLAAGAGITFADGGLHRLKGIDGETQLFRVVAV